LRDVRPALNEKIAVMSMRDISAARDRDVTTPRDIKCQSAVDFEMHAEPAATISVNDVDDGGKLERTPSHSLPAVSLTAPPRSARGGAGAAPYRHHREQQQQQQQQQQNVPAVKNGGGNGSSVGAGGGGEGGSGGAGSAAGSPGGKYGGHGRAADDVPGFGDVDDLGMQVDRDPNRWHDTVKVKFDDIFGEPDPEVFSVDSVWKTSNKAYSASKFWCYRLVSIVFAVPLAVFWGVNMACLVFCRVWCCVPCLRACDLDMQCVRRYNEVVARSVVAPFMEAAGRLCYHMRVKVVRTLEDVGATVPP
jgi:caveolin 3